MDSTVIYTTSIAIQITDEAYTGCIKISLLLYFPIPLHKYSDGPTSI